jgi:energy-coupling factor transport system ATP-binding protein
MSDGEIIMDGVPREVFLDAETLRRTGLDVPETAALLYKLKNDGFNLPLGALTVDECADAIYASLGEEA